jgi:SAM-dependent methyltransferase
LYKIEDLCPDFLTIAKLRNVRDGFCKIKPMKDLFSSASDEYARYRPTYPPALFEYLNGLLPVKNTAWDCGTGNGQVAQELAKTFKAVYATDISAAQLEQAPPAENIFYSVQPAEQTSFEAHIFDLVVVAQAIHWFDFDRFYAEVRHTAKKEALLCATGYGRPQISEPIDTLITDFYENTLGGYWDAERRFIDEHYKTLPFPFPEIQAPAFENQLQWNLPQFIGYLNTWSAVAHFRKQNGANPVTQLQQELEEHWPAEEVKEIRFPLLLRIGRITEA